MPDSIPTIDRTFRHYQKPFFGEIPRKEARAMLRCAVVLVMLAWAFSAKAAVNFEMASDQVSSAAVSVSVVGAFNSWNAEANPLVRAGTLWRASADLPNGLHQYKFVWKDAAGKTHWMNDPANPYQVDNGNRGANSIFNVQSGVRVAIPSAGWERFEWNAPEAKWVSLAGDFNAWRLGQFSLVRDKSDASGARWLAFLPLKRPFAYKIIVDGIWKTDLRDRAQLVPNEIGGFNSFRPADSVTSPSRAAIERPIAAGDVLEFDAVTSYAHSGDYGHAVALARKIAEINTAASGSTSPLVLRAINAEAAIHKRWNRLDDAAACWQRLVDSNVKTTDTFKACAELAAYHFFVKKNLVKGREFCQRALQQAPNNTELIRKSAIVLTSELNEKHWDAALAMIEELLAMLPPPDDQDKTYAAELTELWLMKAYAHRKKNEEAKAREAYDTVLKISPWPDSMNAQTARRWLEQSATPPGSGAAPEVQP